MSRAFVTDKEDWIYCAKAGERCMHAEEGKPCRKTDCEHFGKAVKRPTGGSDRIVSRVPRTGSGAKTGGTDAKAGGTDAKAGGSDAKTTGSGAKAGAASGAGRPTRKSKLKKPRRWGGRSLPNG